MQSKLLLEGGQTSRWSEELRPVKCVESQLWETLASPERFGPTTCSRAV